MSAQTPVFRAAVVQTLAELGDIPANIALVRRYVAEAVRQGANLVVLPECMNSGYLFDSLEHARAIAEPLDGEYPQAIQSLCREHGLHIATGFTELGEDGRIYNSGLFYDPEGALCLHYQKQFLATHDQNWFECGVNGNPVVDTALGRIGLLICFDGRIPEIARSLALQGADVILDMANFFAMDQADLWVPARAMENGVWIVAGTKAGVERSIYYPGGSMIVSPDGEVMAYVEQDTHGVASWDVDVALARKKRWLAGGDRFSDRRPDTYCLIDKPVEQTPLGSILEAPLVPEQSTGKVAAVQAHALQEGTGLEEAWQMVEHAARLGVKLVVTAPFLACSHWLPDSTEAIALADQTFILIERAKQIARRWQTHILFTSVEREGGAFYHTAFLVGPEGETIGKYRQVHVEPELKDWCTAGDVWPVFETAVGRVGVILGYDGRFPESTRELALGGADIVAYPALWREKRERDLLLLPKAEDNRIYVVAANRTDTPFIGGSLVVPPNGFPMWQMDLVAPVNRRHGAVMPALAHLALSRQKFMIPKVNMFRNRLTETYGALISTERG